MGAAVTGRPSIRFQSCALVRVHARSAVAFSTLAMLAPIAAVASAWLISPMWSPDFPVLVLAEVAEHLDHRLDELTQFGVLALALADA